MYLGHKIELHHSIGQWFSVRFETGYQSQHGSVECTIDLAERNLPWIVHIYHWDMTQESEILRLTNKFSITFFFYFVGV